MDCLNIPFLGGSGSSSYFAFDILGYQGIGTMKSFVHYQAYLHVRANGTTTNDIDFEVVAANEVGTNDFKFGYKQTASTDNKFYIKLPVLTQG